jgi:hypothetical protein
MISFMALKNDITMFFHLRWLKKHVKIGRRGKFSLSGTKKCVVMSSARQKKQNTQCILLYKRAKCLTTRCEGLFERGKYITLCCYPLTELKNKKTWAVFNFSLH